MRLRIPALKSPSRRTAKDLSSRRSRNTGHGSRLLPCALPRRQLIAHKRELLPIRRPRRHVHGSLSAEQFRHHGNLLVFQRHHTQHYVFVLWIAFHGRLIRQEHHLLTVRRNVRKPIVLFTKRDLLLLAPIRSHPPDLHVPRAFGVAVNGFTIGRVVRAVVHS